MVCKVGATLDIYSGANERMPEGWWTACAQLSFDIVKAHIVNNPVLAVLFLQMLHIMIWE